VVTEFAEGGDLNMIIEHNLKRESYLPEKLILRWLEQITNGKKICLEIFFLTEKKVKGFLLRILRVEGVARFGYYS
jgi:serine/threonine protein kinase